jgi:hypothetical protein
VNARPGQGFAYWLAFDNPAGGRTSLAALDKRKTLKRALDPPKTVRKMMSYDTIPDDKISLHR